jgi:tape measure domain-containing protein
MNDSLKSRYRSRVLFLKEFHRLQISEAGLDLKSVASSAVSLVTKEQSKQAEKGSEKLKNIKKTADQYNAVLLAKALAGACSDIDKFVGGGAAVFQNGFAALQASMSKGKLSSGEENGLLKSCKFLSILENGFGKLIPELEKNSFDEKKSMLENLGFEPKPEGGGSIANIKQEAGPDEEKKNNVAIISRLKDVMDESFAPPDSGFFQSVIVKALTGIPYIKDGGEEEFFISLLSIPIENLLKLGKVSKAGGFSSFNSFSSMPRKEAIKKGEEIKTVDDFAAAVIRYAGKQEEKSDDEISKLFNDADAAKREEIVDEFFQKVAEESKQDKKAVHLVVSTLMKGGMLKVNESKFFGQVFVTGKSLSRQISFLLQEEGSVQSSQAKGGNDGKKQRTNDKKSEKPSDDKDPISKLADVIIKSSKELKDIDPNIIVSILKVIPSAFLDVH